MLSLFQKQERESTSLSNGFSDTASLVYSEGELAQKNMFYKQFIEESRLISCKIVNVKTIPSTTFRRSYAVIFL